MFLFFFLRLLFEKIFQGVFILTIFDIWKSFYNSFMHKVRF